MGGLLLYGFHIHEIVSIPQLLPWVSSFLGIIAIVTGVCELLFKKTKEMQIEETDERNKVIANAAKATGFEVMTSLFATAIAVLALLGTLTKIVFFTFFAVFMLAQIAFVVRLWYLQKKM